METGLVNQWRRVEGVILTRKPVAKELSNFLKELNVLACLDWYKDSPTSINISLMESEDKIAGSIDGVNIEAKHDYKTLVQKLADKFEATVTFDEYSEDYIDGVLEDVDGVLDDTDDDLLGDEDSYVGNTNCVVVTRTPSSVFPFVANIDNRKLGVVELLEDKRAVLQTANSFENISVIESCDTPYVAFYGNEGEYYFVYMPTSKIEESISFVWNENVELIYGAMDNPSEAIVKVVKDVLSPYNIAPIIASATENVNVDNVANALSASGEEGVVMLMSEFGLSSAISGFLTGKYELEYVNNVIVHEPRGYANAVTRSFNTVDNKKHSIFWKNYYSLSVENPWVLNVFAAVIGVVGATLFTNAITKEKRTFKSSLGGVVGIFLMVEAVAEYMLNKYIGLREESNRRENNDW